VYNAATQMPSTNRELRFVSSNPHKIAEAQEILEPHRIKVISSPLKIEELQTTDTPRLVHDKVLKAFRQIGRPLFVEHTGLYLTHLNGLPGGLTQIFWDSLQADRFAELFGKLAPNRAVTARTALAYCDGKKIYDFDGKVEGQIVPEPRGNRDFQWDCVFQPNGYKLTFAEMGEKKNDISMRRLALDSFAAYLAKDH
jgi:XTP/dITP diphosphohydrolase